MIISHRHRFIFIKTRKTASTSVELFLRQFCGPDDVITRDAPDDERLARTLGLPKYLNERSKIVLPWHIRPLDLWWSRRNRTYPRRGGIPMHITAAEIRDLVGMDTWNSYTKITTVRNPWDVVISLHYWRAFARGKSRSRRESTSLSLDESIERAGQNWRTYTINGIPCVDHVIRFESLHSDLTTVTDELGLTAQIELPHAKGSIRPPKTESSTILTEKQARRIAELARGEIEWLGYHWPGTPTAVTPVDPQSSDRLLGPSSNPNSSSH